MQFMKNKSVCVGSGLVTLDVIYKNDTAKPIFLAGGSCGNVLTILSYLGWDSYPIARLGDDPEGNRIIEDMKKWKVKTKFIEQESSTHSPRIIERIFSDKIPRHRFYIKCNHKNWLPRRKAFLLKSLENIQDKIPKSNVYYFDRASPSALELAINLKKQGSIIIFEPPKFLHDTVFLKCLQIADIVKHCNEQSYDTEKLKIDIPLEIRTRGKRGLRYRAKFLKNSDWIDIDSIPAYNLVDAAGAGDWLIAGLIHVLFQNKSKYTPAQKKLEFALRFGQALASLNCNFIGARGIMYNLSKPKLFNLIGKIIKNKEKLITLNLAVKNTKMNSKLTKKCKVCLCTN